MTLLSSPFKSRATAIPKAAEIDAGQSVSMDVTHGKAAQCPYCSTVYRLAPGAIVHDAH